MPDGALWRFPHPDARLIAGFRWGRIQASPAGEWLRDRLGSSPFFPLIEGADTLLVSSPGTSRGVTVLPYLVAIEGSVPRDHLRANAHLAQACGSAEILVAPAFVAALVGETTCLVGDLESVKAAALRGDPAPNPLAERARRVSAECDAWVLTSAGPGAFLDGYGWVAGAVDISRLEAAVSLRRGMFCELMLETPSPESAARFCGSLEGALRMGLLQGQDSPWAPWLEQLELRAAGDAVRAEFILDPEELVRFLSALAPPPQAADSPWRSVVRCRNIPDAVASENPAA